MDDAALPFLFGMSSHMNKYIKIFHAQLSVIIITYRPSLARREEGADPLSHSLSRLFNDKIGFQAFRTASECFAKPCIAPLASLAI